MRLHITIPATLRTPLRAVAERLNLALGATMRVAFAWYADHKGRDLPPDTMTARAYNAPASVRSAKFAIPPEWESAPGVATPTAWVRALSEWLAAGTPTGEIARSRLHLRAERAAGAIPDRRRVTGANRPGQKSSRKVRSGDARRAEFLAEDPTSRWPAGMSAADVRHGHITGRPTLYRAPYVTRGTIATPVKSDVLAELRRRGEADVQTVAGALGLAVSTVRAALYNLSRAGLATQTEMPGDSVAGRNLIWKAAA